MSVTGSRQGGKGLGKGGAKSHRKVVAMPSRAHPCPTVHGVMNTPFKAACNSALAQPATKAARNAAHTVFQDGPTDGMHSLPSSYATKAACNAAP